MKKLVVLMLSLMMVLAMTACGNDQQAANNSGNASGGEASANEGSGMITVTIEIDYPDNSGIADVDDLKMQVEAGSSALQVLQKYGQDNNVKVVMSDTSKTAYVVSINGVDETSAAGWTYEINDEMTMDAANECIVTEGMEISWDYTSWSDMD